MRGVRIDPAAVLIGAVVALLFAVPAGALSAVVVNDNSSNGVFGFYAVIIIGMLAGGFVAGTKRPDAPLTHGAIAALVAYVVAQAVTLAIKAIDGSSLRSPAVYVFNALLMASLGIVGGLIADRRNARVS